MRASLDNFTDYESIEIYRKENPFLADLWENLIMGFINEFDLHIEVCEHNIGNNDLEDAYEELKAAFDSESWISTLKPLAEVTWRIVDDEKREASHKFFSLLNNIFKVLEDAGYDLADIRDQILDQIWIPREYSSILGVRMNPQPSNTYIIRCHVATADALDDKNIKFYSTDHVAPDKWDEILKASIHNDEEICVLEGEQLTLNKEIAAIFLDYAENRNVYLPLSIISEIKKHFRCIDYSDYIRSYGQARTIVDLFKEYHKSHPIQDIDDWNKAVALIVAGIGKKSAIDEHVIAQVIRHPELFKLQDSGFDVERFAELVLDEQNLATDTYEGIMRTRSISKLWYIIRVLLGTRNYKTDSEFRSDLLRVLKKAYELDSNGKSVLADSDEHFQWLIEKMIGKDLQAITVSEDLKEDWFNPILWDEFLFNRYFDKIKELGFSKFLRYYSPNHCFGVDDLKILKTDIKGFPTIRIVDGERNYCMYDYYGDWGEQLQEIYEWKLIKDIVLASNEYADVYLSEDDVFDKDGNLIKGLPVNYEFWNNLDGIEFHFPINEADNNLPIFFGNQGKLPDMTKDEKLCLLTVLRKKYLSNNQSK